MFRTIRYASLSHQGKVLKTAENYIRGTYHTQCSLPKLIDDYSKDGGPEMV